MQDQNAQNTRAFGQLGGSQPGIMGSGQLAGYANSPSDDLVRCIAAFNAAVANARRAGWTVSVSIKEGDTQAVSASISREV